MKKYTYCILLSVLSILLGYAELDARSIIDINKDWSIYPAYNFAEIRKTPVNLPHSWNVEDVKTGKMNYDRSTYIYEKELSIGNELREQRLFLFFEGVNSVANVFVNGKTVGEHYGGYTAFCLEITDYVNFGDKNKIQVYVSNAFRLDVLPLIGDFNVYGGIHRPVSLIATDKNCITPLDYASSGIYINQNNVSKQLAQVSVTSKLSVKDKDKQFLLKTTIYNKEGKIVKEDITEVYGQIINQSFIINNPILWNGKNNPYLYKVRVDLLKDGTSVDFVEQPLGLRFFHVDPSKGFFLNGEHLDLYGFGRHEDVEGKASALSNEDHEKDMELILESGSTSLRMTHYPHSKQMYDMCDENGIVVWTEIPLVGPGGYTGPGYVNNAKHEDHAKTILQEMIRQNYNHPSICFWGLFNELKSDFDNPVPFIQELNTLAKAEDPFRLTTVASNVDSGIFNNVSDLIAWNKYYGWYEGDFSDIGKWADKVHTDYPSKPIAVSEYGAGASPYKHSEEIVKPEATGAFHPEEWQTLYHEANWDEMNKRPYLWAKYIWAFADFGSSIRTEGDVMGMNDKGLISYDRTLKKDAFYFYKANWSDAPTLYIANKRFVEREKNITSVKVFSNGDSTELWVNGKSQGKKKKDSLSRIIWDNVSLSKGENKIVVKSRIKNQLIEDSCDWILK